MTYDTSAYDIAKIRELLINAFEPEELRRFCLDRPVFRPIVAKFGPGMGLDDMVDRVIGYCRTRLLFPELLADVKEANPRQYARFEPELRVSKPVPAHPPPPRKPRTGLAIPLPRAWQSWYWMLAGFLLVLAVGIGIRLLLWPGTASMPEPSAGDTWTRPADGAVMVYVSAGEFLMGSTDEDIDAILARCTDCSREWYTPEQPQHTVHLDAFWIDKTEVTNAQYRTCVEAEVCTEPQEWDYEGYSAPDQPAVGVRWQDAQTYAAWVGGRLPTEAEWEKACRGTDGQVYPWGSTFDGIKLNYCDRNCWLDWSDENADDGYALTAPVRSYPTGASPYGALDMVGNVSEWTADWYEKGYYAHSPERNPQGPDSGTQRVMRGGAIDTGQMIARCTYRTSLDPTYWGTSRGFRVVVDTVHSEP